MNTIDSLIKILQLLQKICRGLHSPVCPRDVCVSSIVRLLHQSLIYTCESQASSLLKIVSTQSAQTTTIDHFVRHASH